MIRMPTARVLALHEARIHAGRRRELRDVGHGYLLHDPTDPEPFWNRLVAPDFPTDAQAFDERLTETIVLFGTIARYPHLRPLADGIRPRDLVRRLIAAGFEAMGEDLTMVVRDPETSRRAAHGPLPAGTSIEVIAERPADPSSVARELATTLAAAFGVDVPRQRSIELDALATLGRRRIEFVVARVEGIVVSVAKRTSVGGMAYLSSIGTLPAMRGRGLGRLVTASATASALAGGDRVVHLVVESGNHAAIAMYTGLGYEAVGRPVPDLLLRA